MTHGDELWGGTVAWPAFLSESHRLCGSGWAGTVPGAWGMRGDGGGQQLFHFQPDTRCRLEARPAGHRATEAELLTLWPQRGVTQPPRRLKALGRSTLGAMKVAVALLLLLAASWAPPGRGLLAEAAEPRAATHAFRQGATGAIPCASAVNAPCREACTAAAAARRHLPTPLPTLIVPPSWNTAHAGAPTNSSSFGIMSVASAVSVKSILAAGVAAVVFLVLDKWWRSATAKQQCDRCTPRQAEGLQPPPAWCVVQPKQLPKVPSTVVEVAARATSLQPPPRTIKAVSLQLSHSMPAAVSPFAEAAAAVPALQTQPSQPAPAAAPAAQPSPQAQQSPFAAAAVQPKQPKQLSQSAGAAQQRAAPAAAATSPFAAEASALNGPPSAASSEAQQLPSRGSAASKVARRPSPPHLSTMLDALPMFSAAPSGPSTAQGVAAGPPAAPPASLPGQRPRSPGGRHPPAHPLPKDRISLEQLRSEILGDEALSCSEAQLESVLSSRLPAAGAAAAGAAAAGGASGGAQQPACGSPGASLPSSPSCGHDSDWEIAPNGAQGCRGAGCAAAVLCPRRCLCCTADLHACLRWPCSPHAPPARPTELEICKRPDGLLWQLGAGGFGRVYKAMRFGCTPVAVVGGRGRGAWVGAAVWHAITGFDPSSCTVCLSSPSSPLLRPAAESHGGALGRGRAVHHGQGSRYAAPAEACVALVVLGSLHMPNSPHWFHCSLQPASEPTPRSFEDFKREARLLQRCKDPHIVSFLGASLNSDFTILVRIAMAVLRHLVCRRCWVAWLVLAFELLLLLIVISHLSPSPQVTEFCEGGSLSANLAAGKISWYRHGKQVRSHGGKQQFAHCHVKP